MKPWYHEGLRFTCTGCGQCCSKEPGYVWISQEEIAALAKRLEITESDFLKRYARRVGDRYSLKEDPRNFDCVFLQNNRCSVYTDRPKQCRTFPWWKDNLDCPQSWKETSRRCEGIDHIDAPLISLEEIEKHLH